MEQETTCYQCGSLLKPPLPPPPKEEVHPAEPSAAPSAPPLARMFKRKSKEPEKKSVSLDDVLKLDDLYASPKSDAETRDVADTVSESADSAPKIKTMVTMTGEVVEVEDAHVPAATIADAEIEARDEAPVFIQTYCSHCGYQNEEGVRECKKCGSKLAVLNQPPGEIAPLRRSWGFDVLGAAWIFLGLSAIYSGIFLIRVDHKSGITLSDYFWTLIVAAAPGILIFMRHVFCKILFWVMSFVSLFIWLIIGFIWQYIGLRLSSNGQIGLTWFAMFSALSFVSWITVRMNDEFDYSF